MHKHRREAAARLGDFASDARGTIAIIACVSGLALMLAAGLAVDMLRAHNGRAGANAAADTAVLAAVSAAAEASKAGKRNWKKIAEEAGRAAFEQNLPHDPELKLRDIKIDVESIDGRFTGKVDYEADYPTTFLKLAGIGNVGVSNSASAGKQMPSYIDVHFLIDASSSMGIGATRADQQRMINAVGCALACHYDDVFGDRDQVAEVQNAGATTRIDVVREGVEDFLDEAERSVTTPDQLRISIHLFSNSVQTLQAPTTDLVEASLATRQIQLISTNFNGGTNVSYAMNQLADLIGDSGDGSSPDSRKSFVVFMSDGVQDSIQLSRLQSGLHEYIYDRNFVPLPERHQRSANFIYQGTDPSACSVLKSRGHAVIAAELQYVLPEIFREDDRHRLQYIENTLIPRMPAQFAECASAPDMSLSVAKSSDIAPAFEQILNLVMAPTVLRLTE